MANFLWSSTSPGFRRYIRAVGAKEGAKGVSLARDYTGRSKMVDVQGNRKNIDWMAAYNNMVDVYATESDRAAAILVGSFLDNQLGDLLLAFMVNDAKIADLFEGDRPMATFSARISVAFALGVLPANIHSDLTLIRKIRNHFAHSASAVRFADAPARDWCRALSLVNGESGVSVQAAAESEPRNQFLMTVASVTIYLHHMMSGLESGDLRRCVVPPAVRVMQ